MRPGQALSMRPTSPHICFSVCFLAKEEVLQVSVYQMHAFIVIDLHGVTCLCSYRRFVTAGN